METSPETWSREELDAWFELVHRELRDLATAQRRRSAGPAASGTTSLLHLAYERLARHEQILVEDPAHFFSLAARIMRHVLIDQARAAQARKRGAGTRALPLDELEPWLMGRFADESELATMIDLEGALEQLERHDDELVRLVEHHIHLGMTLEEYASLNDVSLSTVKRRWRLARAHLSRALEGPG